MRARASASGRRAAERAGYLAARGLPGVYAPEAAAAVIRRAIFRELDLEECP